MHIFRHYSLSDPVRSALVNLYIKTFAQSPYNELFTPADVNKYFDEYLKHGFYVAYVEDIPVRHPTGVHRQKPVGLLCSDINHDFGSFNTKIEETEGLATGVYLSELIVDSDYRRRGIGSKLIEAFNNDAINQTVYLRTSKNNNDHVIKMYQRFGFSLIPGLVQLVENRRTDGTVDRDDRVFMIRHARPHFPQ